MIPLAEKEERERARGPTSFRREGWGTRYRVSSRRAAPPLARLFEGRVRVRVQRRGRARSRARPSSLSRSPPPRVSRSCARARARACDRPRVVGGGRGPGDGAREQGGAHPVPVRLFAPLGTRVRVASRPRVPSPRREASQFSSRERERGMYEGPNQGTARVVVYSSHFAPIARSRNKRAGAPPRFLPRARPTRPCRVASRVVVNVASPPRSCRPCLDDDLRAGEITR